MSDDNAGHIRSHIVPLAATMLNTAGGTLYTNNRPATTAVITFIALVNTSSNSGDTIFLTKNTGLTTQTVFHSGVVGAGTGDRFPLECEIAIQTGENVGWIAAIGSWGVLLSGYLTPTVFTG